MISAFDFPLGLKSEPPLPPPIGNVVSEFLNVCSKAKNLRIDWFTEAWKRIPPLYGPMAENMGMNNKLSAEEQKRQEELEEEEQKKAERRDAGFGFGYQYR